MTQLDFIPPFKEYVKSVLRIQQDVSFWKGFLTNSIESYREKNPENRWIRNTGFTVRDYEPDGSGGFLRGLPEDFKIEIKDLDSRKNEFFIWVKNMGFVRVYNSLEMLLLEAIQKQYFPELASPLLGKANVDKLTGSMKTILNSNGLPVNTKNNRHLIEFLKFESLNFSMFLEAKVRIKWNTDWKNFFEFISVMRHIIVHDGMRLSKDNRNLLKQISKDLFQHYFLSTAKIFDVDALAFKDDESYFTDILDIANSFAANAVKFLAGEKDFTFIGLH